MDWKIGDPQEPGSTPREAVSDCLLLALVVLLSGLPYLRGLGLYSDDWAFISELSSAGESFREMWEVLVPMGLTTRPVHGMLLAGLYSMFELKPLGYHLVNHGMMAATAVLFYLSLRLLGIPRLLTLALPLVFSLLPHYSTDRFWIAAFQANASVLLYFISLYADLRFVQGTGPSRWAWKALGAAGLAGSVLAYEVTGALFLVNVPVLLYAAHAREKEPWKPRLTGRMAAIAANVLVLALVVGFKMTTTVRADVSGGYRYRILRIVQEAVPVHFGEYGLALPVRVLRVLRDYPDATAIAVSLLIGGVVAVYLFSLMRGARGRFDEGVSWPAVVCTGVVLFGAGYAVTLMTWEVGFHATGSNNRTAVAAAIGVAWVFVGVVGWLASLLRAGRTRRIAFAAATGVLVASNVLIINSIAEFWIAADQRQQEVISSIQERFPELPGGTTLLLDGVCPFEGPAMMFVTGWDVKAMLQLLYGERSLEGDVIRANTEIRADGIHTLFFDDVANLYPYGERLIAYHLSTGDVAVLADVEGARRYFEEVSVPARVACPSHTDGDGAPIF